MNQQKHSRRPEWIKILTGGYNYLLAIFGLLVVANASGLITASFASEAAGQAADTGGFQATICTMFALMGQIVGGVAVVMIIAAGIMYAGSGGSDKGAVGIGSAKNMIISAITGVALFLLGGLVLGDCNAADTLRYGDLIRGLLPSQSQTTESAP